MDRLPSRTDLTRPKGYPLSERHWRCLVELVVTATDMDVDTAETFLESARAFAALSHFRRGSDPGGREPNAEILERFRLGG